MNEIWKKLTHIGLDKVNDDKEKRYVILTNGIAMITGCISLLILVMVFIAIPEYGFTSTRQLIFASFFIFLLPLLFNYLGKFNVSRLFVCWTPPLVIMLISIFNKTFQTEYVGIRDFFYYRFLLFAVVMHPLLIFHTRQRKYIFLGLLPSFLSLLLFDLIHNTLEIGFFDFGFRDDHYILVTIFAAISYLGLLGFIYGLKITTDNFENEVFDQNKKIVEQNEEITIQAEKLQKSNEALLDAMNKIEYYSKDLEKQILHKTKDLSLANEQLTLHVNELRQFSYTLSHHLKSPVASLKGLLNLVEKEKLAHTNTEIFDHLEKIIKTMDRVFYDLNEIIELRHGLHHKITKVDIRKIFDEVSDMFTSDISQLNIRVENRVENQIIRTNDQKLRSILFNMISNAIKFSSPNRMPIIRYSFEENGDYYEMKVRDNGVGIDLDLYDEKVFSIYQRFHNHVEGRGLGLYLIKLQAESLGGYAKIDSKVDEFTEIEVGLRRGDSF